MIRAAHPDDLPRLIEMGRDFNQEAGYADSVPFDVASFAEILLRLGHAGMLLTAEESGKVVGMAAADVGPSICNREVRIGREAFWYFEPAHRKGGGREMLLALELAAKNRGATFFDVVAEDGKRSEALARLYRAAAYSPSERTFRKAL